MYQMAPAEQPRPGTQLVQRVDWRGPFKGFGSYFGTPTYFSTPAGQSGILGLGCACGCAGRCNQGLMGLTMDGTGLLGTGLFAGGFNVSTWGPAEVVTAAAGVYVLYSVFFTTRAGVRRGHRKVSAFRRA